MRTNAVKIALTRAIDGRMVAPRARPSHSPVARAFTLVELLVVVGIITILIALLFPAIVGVRRQAHAAICAANLRSIGQALTMYTQQCGYYPGLGIVDATGSSAQSYAIWPVRLRIFMGGEHGAFKCPAQDERCDWKKVAPDPGALGTANESHARYGYELGEPLLGSGTPFSYGYNGEGTGRTQYGEHGLGSMLAMDAPSGPSNRELRATRVRKPAEMVAVTDAYGSGMGDFVVEPNPYWWFNAPGAVHNGGSNVLFCDGHVQWYRQKDLLVTNNLYVPSEEAVRRMWNNDHKVNAGIAYDREDPG